MSLALQKKHPLSYYSLGTLEFYFTTYSVSEDMQQCLQCTVQEPPYTKCLSIPMHSASIVYLAC